MGSQVMRWTFKGKAAPWKSVRVTPSLVRTASSPSARKWMLRVWWRMPGTSEARKNSPSPMPMTAGGPMRAATSLLGSCAERTPMEKAPVMRLTARLTASSRGIVGLMPFLVSGRVRTASAVLASGEVVKDPTLGDDEAVAEDGAPGLVAPFFAAAWVSSFFFRVGMDSGSGLEAELVSLGVGWVFCVGEV